MIKGVIWDVDGTLLDSMLVWKTATEQYLSQFGYDLTEKAYVDMFTMSLEESSRYLKETYGLSDSPEEIQRKFLSEIASFYRFDVQAKAGVPAFLEYLKQKNIPMAIATAGDRTLLIAALERLGLLSYFSYIVTCSDFHTDKNSPLIYRQAAKHLGTEPDETMVMEDTLYAIKTAKKAGFYVVAVADAASSEDEKRIRETADVYLADLTQAAFLLEKSDGEGTMPQGESK